jgi:hypothetical protein
MIKDSQHLLTILQQNFGEISSPNKKGDVGAHCPFPACAGSHKQKLRININTGYWHCWVCDAGSKSILSLFIKTKKPKQTIDQVAELYDKKTKAVMDHIDTGPTIMALPQEFRSLMIPRKDPEYRQAMFYLKKRGITIDTIAKYNMGYCSSGRFKQRLIVPSYNEDGTINYFVARTYYKEEEKKYDNPPNPKTMVPFEMYISWKFPVILVEGIFDAIAIDRNAVPILGNTVSPAIINKLLIEGVKEVYLALDDDAQKFIYRNILRLIEAGIQVHVVMLPPGKDPGDMSQTEFFTLLERSMDSSDISNRLQFKMMGL